MFIAIKNTIINLDNISSIELGDSSIRIKYDQNNQVYILKQRENIEKKDIYLSQEEFDIAKVNIIKLLNPKRIIPLEVS